MDLQNQFKKEKNRNPIVAADINERGEFIIFDQDYVFWLEKKLAKLRERIEAEIQRLRGIPAHERPYGSEQLALEWVLEQMEELG